MRRIPLLGVALASVLAFPGVASAHTAKAVIDCSSVKASYTAFAAGKNTVHYKVAVDGVTVKDDYLVLNENGGRAGSLTLPSAAADGKQHKVDFYTAWGRNGGTQTADGHNGGSMNQPLASATVTCGSPPAPEPPPAPAPQPAPAPAPAPAPQPAPAPAPAAPQPVGAPTAPAAASFPSVKSAAAAEPADCVAIPKVYRVRAGQMNTIVVRVRVGGKNIEGAKVKLTAPGITRVKQTDSRGVVTFRVKPRKAGKLYVQSDQCSGADRAAVLAAKQSSGSSAPRFTG